MKPPAVERRQRAYAETVAAMAARLAAERGATPFLEVSADARLWAMVMDLVCARGDLDLAAEAAGPLLRLFPQSDYLRTLDLLLGRMPPRATGGQDLVDQEDEPVQLVPHPRARGALVVFTGQAGRVGMPLAIADRWLARTGLHRIYLRDLGRTNYVGGVQGLGEDFETAAEGLRRLVASIGATRAFCYGNSVGGYAALRYALLIEAEAVLVFGAATNMTEDFVGGLLDKHAAPAAGDLRPLFAAAPRPPRARLVYSADFERDAHAARNLEGLPTVVCEAVAGGSHHVMIETIRQGRYEALLDWLVGAEAPHTDEDGSEAARIERRICEIYQDVLELHRVDPGDDLVSLGGDSHQAVILALELEEAFGVEMPVETLGELGAVREVAAFILQARAGAGAG